MNDDLISRSALLVVPNVRKVTEFDEAGYGMSYNAVPAEAIENAPAVDAEPVRRGRWEPVLEFVHNVERPVLTGWKCSECGRNEQFIEPYCNCGAKMDAEVEG